MTPSSNIHRSTARNIALLSSYFPRRCGIGTFTADLADAIAQISGPDAVSAVALNDQPGGYPYPPRVRFQIDQHRLDDYHDAADFLNASSTRLCCVQHEFGLFGGKAGDYVLQLLDRLRMPVVTTLHTVLRQPDADQLRVTRALAERSQRLIVMARQAVTFLTDVYGIDARRITLIPHGIPEVPFTDPELVKHRFGVDGRKVILTFGLLSPNKGIETMIDALIRAEQAE